MNHVLYLLFAVATHVFVGYAVAFALTPSNPTVGVLAGTAPDVDLYFGQFWSFPLVHRGVVHTPAFLVVVLAALALLGVRRTVLVAVGLAVTSHLVVDTFTHAGVMWLYPASVHHVSYDVSAHSSVGDLLLSGAAAALVRWGPRDVLRLSPGREQNAGAGDTGESTSSQSE